MQAFSFYPLFIWYNECFFFSLDRRTALLRMAKKRSSRDGLNTVKYRVVWRHDSISHTHLMIDIGRNHRWHFMDSQQRLIINFWLSHSLSGLLFSVFTSFKHYFQLKLQSVQHCLIFHYIKKKMVIIAILKIAE